MTLNILRYSKSALVALMLSLLWIGLSTAKARGDTWARPSEYEAKSQNGQIVARIEPGTLGKPRTDGSKAAPKVTVSKLKNGTTKHKNIMSENSTFNVLSHFSDTLIIEYFCCFQVPWFGKVLT